MSIKKRFLLILLLTKVSKGKNLLPSFPSSRVPFSVDISFIKEMAEDPSSVVEVKIKEKVSWVIFPDKEGRRVEFKDQDLDGKVDLLQIFQGEDLLYEGEISSQVFFRFRVFSSPEDFLLYVDTDKNGVFDKKEVYQKGALVSLYQDKDQDGVWDIETLYQYEEESFSPSSSLDFFLPSSFLFGGYYVIEGVDLFYQEKKSKEILTRLKKSFSVSFVFLGDKKIAIKKYPKPILVFFSFPNEGILQVKLLSKDTLETLFKKEFSWKGIGEESLFSQVFSFLLQHKKINTYKE